MSVAATILAQLGGSRFVAMTGAKGLIGLERGLSFQIGRNASKANRVRITLEGTDTYTVETSRYANFDVTPVARVDNVYCDQLVATFKHLTGLETSL